MTNIHVNPNPYEGYTPKQALAAMRKLVKAETRNHILMGLLYNYLVDSKLLEGSDSKSPLDFICDNIEEVSRTALLDYSAVARAFSEEVGTQYGVTRLRLLLTYKDATKLELNHQEPGTASIMVPDKKGQVTPKLFADCSLEDMRQALKLVRETTPATPFPPEDRALVDGYREAVVRCFPQGSQVRVQLRKHKGESVVDLRAIPVGQMGTLIEALLEQYSSLSAVQATTKRHEEVRPS